MGTAAASSSGSSEAAHKQAASVALACDRGAFEAVAQALTLLVVLVVLVIATKNNLSMPTFF